MAWIDDPSAHHQIKLYFGNGNANNSITNSGNSDMQPDLIWFKSRDSAFSHYYVDSSRGRDKGLYTDSNSVEVTSSGSTTDCQSFDSDGFTVGTPEDANSTNYNGDEIVAWQWKFGGGSTITNTNGDINSTVQINSDVGCSIVQYSPSNTTARNIGHGLGVKPGMIWIRNRGRTEDTIIWNHRVGTGGARLNATSSYNTSTSNYVNTVNSSTFNVGGDFAVNGGYNYIAYCWAETQGFSKFGKYAGNGSSTQGTFVYTGFRPSFVLTHGVTIASQWRLYDSTRDIDNPAHARQFPYTAITDQFDADASIDIFSNGFRINSGSGDINASGYDYHYYAFAENPFVTSSGVPGTAR